MTRLRRLRGFLRTLVGLSDRSGGFWGIDRSVMNDIERARWKRAMRGRFKAMDEYAGRLVADPEFLSSQVQRMLEPPPVRPMLYPPDLYRKLLARSGASLRPPRRSRHDGDVVLDEHGDLVPIL